MTFIHSAQSSISKQAEETVGNRTKAVPHFQEGSQEAPGKQGKKVG